MTDKEKIKKLESLLEDVHILASELKLNALVVVDLSQEDSSTTLHTSYNGDDMLFQQMLVCLFIADKQIREKADISLALTKKIIDEHGGELPHALRDGEKEKQFTASKEKRLKNKVKERKTLEQRREALKKKFNDKSKS